MVKLLGKLIFLWNIYLIIFWKSIEKMDLKMHWFLRRKLFFEMNIEPEFREKCMKRKKKQFDENIDNEIVKSLQEYFRIDYFLYIVDKTITKLQSIFE